MTKFILDYTIPADDYYPDDAPAKIDNDSFEEAFFYALYLRDIAEDITVLHALTGEVFYPFSCDRRNTHLIPKRKHQSLISKHFCNSAHSCLVAENYIAQEYAKDTGEPQHIFTWAEWCKVIYKRGA